MLIWLAIPYFSFAAALPPYEPNPEFRASEILRQLWVSGSATQAVQTGLKAMGWSVRTGITLE